MVIQIGKQEAKIMSEEKDNSVYDLFNQIKKERSEENRSKEEELTPQIIDWCEKRRAYVLQLQPWHLRIKHKDFIIDLFLPNGRWHNIKTNERGGYKNIWDFLNHTVNQYKFV